MRKRYPTVYENSKFFRSIYEAATENNSTFSGTDLDHIDRLLGLVGSATAGLKKKPGLEEMASLVAELVKGVDFTIPAEG